MFNGIIYQQGTVSKFSRLNAGTKIFIKSKLKLDKKDIGSSIACDGVCLTLVSKRRDGSGGGRGDILNVMVCLPALWVEGLTCIWLVFNQARL